MARNGKNVVLVRDMTDTMYNPARAPYVSHFTGTDLIVEHIEKWVCPTVTSDQILGGKPFRFPGDRRPHVAIIMAEDEYRTEKTLPQFARDHLGKDCQVSLIFGSDQTRNNIPGLEALDHADLVLLSVRRRPLPAEQLARIRKFIEAGKPVVALRTSSHGFAPPLGTKTTLATWPTFDPDVLGGNYKGHHKEGPKTAIEVTPEGANHPILAGVKLDGYQSGGSLYKVSPLKKSTRVLLQGSTAGQPKEPVAWVNQTAAGGKVFYTALGHVSDFEQPAFQQLLRNAILWAAAR
jgi:type 1 glutamine amidotransferase